VGPGARGLLLISGTALVEVDALEDTGADVGAGAGDLAVAEVGDVEVDKEIDAMAPLLFDELDGTEEVECRLWLLLLLFAPFFLLLLVYMSCCAVGGECCCRCCGSGSDGGDGGGCCC